MSAVASGGSLGNYGPESYSYNAASGNLASKAGVSYSYGDAAHAHAVTSLSNGNSYQYRCNGKSRGSEKKWQPEGWLDQSTPTFQGIFLLPRTPGELICARGMAKWGESEQQARHSQPAVKMQKQQGR